MNRFRIFAVSAVLVLTVLFASFGYGRVAEAKVSQMLLVMLGASVSANLPDAPMTAPAQREFIEPQTRLGSAPCVAGEKTWDGDGATNNWSEAANWTCDAVPLASDRVIFDATSTKNATIDINTSADDLRINSGYAGTVSTAPGVAFSFGRNIASFFTSNQATGSFVCGAGSTITFLKMTFTMTGGNFDCRNGSVTLDVGTININGGTFDAPTGIITLQGSSSGVGSSLKLNAGGTFNHNGGTIVTSSSGASMTGLTQPLVVNNLIFNGQTGQNLADSVVRVLGNLTLNSGGQLTGASPSHWELHGNLTVSNGSPSGSRSNTLITFAGSVDQTFINTGGLNPSATWRINKPSGQLILQSNLADFGNLDIVSGKVNAGSFTVDIGANSATGGNANSYVIGKLRRNRLAAGVILHYPVGSPNGYAPATALFSGLTITVEAKEGVHPAMNPATSLARYWTVSQTGDANANLAFTYQDGDINGDENLYATARINNGVQFLAPATPATNQLTVTSDTLFGDFTAGVTLAPCVAGQKTWDGEGSTNNWSEAANWSCNAVPLTTDKVFFNAASQKNATIDTNVTVSSFEIDGYSGIITNASSVLTVESVSNVGMFRQNSGTFNGGTGTINLSLCCTAATTGFRLQGGTFNSTSGTLNIDALSGSVIDSGATFQHNNGSVNIIGIRSGSVVIGGTATVISFNNLGIQTIANLQGTLAAFARTLTVNGTLVVNGRTDLGSVVMRALGDVTVGASSGAGASNLVFAGSANQAISNLGGTFPFRQITVDKTAGTVTANSPLPLRSTADDLIVTNGTLYLASGANLTARTINIGTNGRLVNDSTVTLTVGTSVVNNGVVDLQGGGAACNETPGVDPITIISSNTTQKPWTGTGVNRLVDVSVTRMGGTGTKNVFSGTNVTGNNASWVFDSGCPTILSISPAVATVQAGQTQSFTAGGGFAPYTFVIATNNSGGSINPTTGVYTAGSTVNVTDTVRVTDGFGATADATVNVLGIPARLAFTAQPTNTVAGQTITPPIQVAVQDIAGNTVSNSTLAVTLSIANNPSPGTLSGMVTRNAVNGIATFDNLSINRAGIGYTLAAQSGSLTAATSDGFDVSVGAASQLLFTVQPANTASNAVISPAVQVAVTDSLGNVVPTATDQITISLGNNPSAGTLAGTLTRTAVNGVVTFNNLAIDNVGSGYILNATSGTLTAATSNAFNITSLVVTNANDSGPGSLRQAILDANALSGRQSITFNIAGVAPFTIQTATQMPTLNDASLDATSQPGYAGAPIIELRPLVLPSTSFAGLIIANSSVKGLNIGGYDLGISVMPGSTGEIRSCFIGTDVTGTLPRANRTGIYVAASEAIIEDNLISGNSLEGILIQGGVATAPSYIRRNKIGSNLSATSALPNNTGIMLKTLSPGNFDRVVIGGSEADENLIAYNTGTGIFNRNFRKVEIFKNSIHSNGLMGIDLKVNGIGIIAEPTLNDPLDPDNGPNDVQNYPVVSSAISTASATTLTGSLNSRPLQTYSIEFYSSANCDATGFGEGENYVGSTNVTTDASGIAGFNVALPILATATVITATATDANGNTSEFSRCTAVLPSQFEISGRITDSTGQALPAAVVRVTTTNPALSFTLLTSSTGNYRFNAPTGSTVVLTPRKANFTFSPASRTIAGVAGPITDQDFVGTSRATISGKVIYPGLSSGVEFPISGVRVRLLGTGSQTVTTDLNGRYTFTNLAAGNYSVTPDHGDLSFTPASRNISLAGVNQTADFSATEAPPLGRLYFGTVRSSGVLGSGRVAGPYISPYSIDVSPDGKRLVLETRVGVVQGVATANFDFSDIRIVVPDNTAKSPVWSPNGDRFAYVSGGAIKTANADGSNPQTVVSTGAYIPSIDWSPDGSQFLISRAGGSLATVRADGQGSPVVLLSNTEQNTKATYSPDGTKIAYLAGEHQAWGDRLMLMNADGTNRTVFMDNSADVFLSKPVWSPDGGQLLVERQAIRNQSERFYTIKGIFSGTERNFPAPATEAFNTNWFFNVAWGREIEQSTNVGLNVGVSAGALAINFGAVTQAGTTTITPISPGAAGTAPNGFVIGNQAYEISTTATVTPPITVCFTIAGNPTSGAFNKMSVFHNENGVLVNRTVSRSFETKQICAQTTSLSPFVLAEEIDAALPSITGVAVDPDGNPLAGVSVALRGTEARDTTTDSDGRFSFVNLTPNGNYNVSPKQLGVLFDEYNKDFVNVTDEQAVVFTGTPQTFSISGTVTDGVGAPLAGGTVTLGGSANDETTTDSNGNYEFSGLPADGSFDLTASRAGNVFPNGQTVEPLTGDASGVDFTAFVPTAADGFVAGRVLTANGGGIRSATVTITDTTNGETRTAQTGTFGIYRFDALETGRTYVVTVSARRFGFENGSRVISLSDSVTDADFIAIQQ